MPYAQDTRVSVESSKAEIEKVLTKYGAYQFISGWDEKHGIAMVQFEMKDRRVRIKLPVPTVESFKTYERKTAYGNTRIYERANGEMKKEQVKEMRRRWRALLLIVKAKLEAVESGISTFEEEFLPYIVIASGRTIGETIIPELAKAADTGRLPPLLPAHGS